MLDLSLSVVRILVSLFAGLFIGFTRKKYPAGVRTFTLICLGSTIFTLISIEPDLIGTVGDPSRVISQILTGIGFIGAGVIWKSQARLGGLTTAAAIWATSALGILIGLGEFIIAGLTLVLIALILYSKKYFPEI